MYPTSVSTKIKYFKINKQKKRNMLVIDCGNSEYFVANVEVLGYGSPPHHFYYFAESLHFVIAKSRCADTYPQ